MVAVFAPSSIGLARIRSATIRVTARASSLSLVRKRRVPVGQLVLDQAVTAGPGNIYRADCLFRVGINPRGAPATEYPKRGWACWG